MPTAVRSFRNCAIALLSFSSSALGAATSNVELRDSWARGDLSTMSKMAEKGDVRAQHLVGLMLHNRGRYQESIDWYERLVDDGDGYAALKIADFHEHGIGVAENKVEATKWLRRGALLGDATSQRQFATALRSGKHVQRNARQSFGWYLAAAKQREPYAYLPLSQMSAAGEGTRRDLIRAYVFAIAAENAGDSSETWPATDLKRDLAEKLTAAQVVRAERNFAALRPDLAEGKLRRNQKRKEFAALVVGLLLGGLAISFHMRRKPRSRLD